MRSRPRRTPGRAFRASDRRPATPQSNRERNPRSRRPDPRVPRGARRRDLERDVGASRACRHRRPDRGGRRGRVPPPVDAPRRRPGDGGRARRASSPWPRSRRPSPPIATSCFRSASRSPRSRFRRSPGPLASGWSASRSRACSRSSAWCSPSGPARSRPPPATRSRRRSRRRGSSCGRGRSRSSRSRRGLASGCSADPSTRSTSVIARSASGRSRSLDRLLVVVAARPPHKAGEREMTPVPPPGRDVPARGRGAPADRSRRNRESPRGALLHRRHPREAPQALPSRYAVPAHPRGRQFSGVPALEGLGGHPRAGHPPRGGASRIRSRGSSRVRGAQRARRGRSNSTRSDASSTEIRRRVAAGESIEGLVSPGPSPPT